MSLSPSREQLIREQVAYPCGRTVMGLNVVRDFLAEIDRLRDQRDTAVEALERIKQMAVDDPRQYHTNPEFHAAVFIAREALDRLEAKT